MSSNPGVQTRIIAARILDAVLHRGRSLKAEFAAALPALPDPRDRALVEAIVFAALRQRTRYDAALAAWMPRPLGRRDGELRALLHAGFAQLDVNYQSDQHFAVEQDPLLTQDAYTLVNLTLGVRDPERGVTASVYVRNLLDETYYTNAAHMGTLGSPQFPNDVTAYIPRDAERLYGVTLGLKF